ncbi:aminotransferase class V-fold PLP-dependent enzyme [Roseibium marinum]|uniref:L-seryl-tRNA(Ser) seleniumtransferase n=1 Tax=Roseibium marinum TaxID=281252 RepID=A0A2S3V2F0_9HYPH|nr:aminotransferase class V-fold PLP-dependent enzyme [Roseibium marinum]POF34085.1 L-seryl-tRNA(Ser) seleniumtransferase [Roseibium marinum]
MSLPTDKDKLWTWHNRNGFRRIINVSGTMTGLGASVTGQTVRDAMCEATRHFVGIHELQARASRTIAGLTGAEAGFLTASAGAGITLAVAGAMTGFDPARAEALPVTPGPKSEVVVQLGHLCGYGAPIETAIALSGATPRAVGQSTLTMDHQLIGALGERTAAALYVVSHHVVHYGQIPFPRFAAICREAGVPVIVDAASEYDLKGFIAAGADIAIYSAHKFLSGPTGGIVAGRKDLVRAAYLQNISIGRGMKIGKESIAGAIAAMEDWMNRDHEAARARETETLESWRAAIADIPGIGAQIVADPTGNPLSRLQVNVDPAKAGTTAAAFARAFSEQDPALIVRDHEVELGYFQLDPCNLLPGQSAIVIDTLREVLRSGDTICERESDLARARNGGVGGYLAWLEDK